MFQPLYDHVLVEKEELEQKSPSGVILATTQDPNDAVYGKVVAVGQGYRRSDTDKLTPLQVQKDQEVLFRPRSATKVTIKRKEYFLLRESDLLGIRDGDDG
jgi:chaperonin GroES